MNISRRNFLTQTTAGLAVGSACANAMSPVRLGRAKHCIMVWLGGGACHIDTWDPKQLGDPETRKAGSNYPAIDTAISGTQVCAHLKRTATVLDRFNIIRSVHHEVIDEHAAATNRMHTGRPTSGTVVYPSIGSVVSHELGAVAENAPPYVLIGYPNVTRGPGFLGSKYGCVHLTDTNSGPSGLTLPGDVSARRMDRRVQLLKKQRAEAAGRLPGKTVKDYDSLISEALRLAGPEFMRAFNMGDEPAALRLEYGGEFGQRCLLARRLCQAGVRFVEVSHNLNFVNGTGWDTHNEGQLNQHVLITELDAALSALVLDLQRHKMLDQTLIVVSTEFGRPAKFDSGGGRGHHSKSFSVVLAGGGLRNGITIGETDALGMSIVSEPVSVPDLHATIYAALGVRPTKSLYSGDRPVPITDGGTPIDRLFG